MSFASPQKHDLEDAEMQRELRLLADQMTEQHWMTPFEIRKEFELEMCPEEFNKLLRSLRCKTITRAEQHRKYRKSDYIFGSKTIHSGLRKWKAMGHVFQTNLRCAHVGCDSNWYSHQTAPVRCGGHKFSNEEKGHFVSITKEDGLRIMQLREEGYSDTQIAGRFGINRSTVYRFRKRVERLAALPSSTPDNRT